MAVAGVLLLCLNLVLPGPGSGEPKEAAGEGRDAGTADFRGSQCVREELSGTLMLAGSSSMERYVSALAEGFMERYPDVAVTVQFTGSGAGIAAVTEGMADIGISSRDLKEEERDRGAVEHLVGLDGIAVCANAACGVEGLTGEQLAGLYTGRIVGWAEPGGSDVPAVVIGREAGSGTRDAFEGVLGVEGLCVYDNELDSTGAVLARILSTPGAVGYVSLEAAQRVRDREREKGRPEIIILALDGTAPSPETVRDGRYPLCRSFFMVTKGETAFQPPLVHAWFEYVQSEEGRAIREITGIAGQVAA